MVSMTCTEAKEAFNHILDMLLDRGDSSSLKRSLIEDGITEFFDLITVMDDVIDSLAYKDPDDKIFYPVKKGDKMLLRWFLAYAQSLEPATGKVDYKAITQANLAIALALCTGKPFTIPTLLHDHLFLWLQLHPILPTILQWLCSVVPSRKTLHYFQFGRMKSIMMSGNVLSTPRR
jgi:hypothetical protein